MVLLACYYGSNVVAVQVRKATDLLGPVEADPEYMLIVEANNLAAEIDNETNTIHKFARDIYTKVGHSTGHD